VRRPCVVLWTPRPPRVTLAGASAPTDAPNAHALGDDRASQRIARQQYAQACGYCARPADTADHGRRGDEGHRTSHPGTTNS
jgi:hypothetical protein